MRKFLFFLLILFSFMSAKGQVLVPGDVIISQRNDAGTVTSSRALSIPPSSRVLGLNKSLGGLGQPNYYDFDSSLVFDDTNKLIKLNDQVVILKIVTLNTGTQTLTATSSAFQIFKGTAPITWTLPVISASIAQVFYIKNRGTDDLTLLCQGSDNLYEYAAQASLAIPAGGNVTLVNDGEYWSVLY